MLVVNEKSQGSSWPLGLIIHVKPNRGDGLVRMVTLRTKSTILDRPIDKIVLLEASGCHKDPQA